MHIVMHKIIRKHKIHNGLTSSIFSHRTACL